MQRLVQESRVGVTCRGHISYPGVLHLQIGKDLTLQTQT